MFFYSLYKKRKKLFIADKNHSKKGYVHNFLEEKNVKVYNLCTRQTV